MEAIEIFGLITTIFGAFAFLPQTIKVVHRKKQNTIELSGVPFRLYATGAGLWMIFSILDRHTNYALIVANAIILFLNAPIIYYLSKHSHASVVSYLFIIICGVFMAVTARMIMGTVDSKIYSLLTSIAAGAFTGPSFFGQMVKSFRERRTKHIAGAFSFMMIFQSMMWITYWIVKSSMEPNNLILWIGGIIWTTIELLIFVPIFVFRLVDQKQVKSTPKYEEEIGSYVRSYDNFFKK